MYKCPNAWQGVPHNKTKQFPADRIEPIVYEALAEYIGKLQKNEDIIEQITANNEKEKQRKELDFAVEQKKLKKIRQDIRVMEEHIPDAMTGNYVLSLDDLVHGLHTHKEKELEQLIVIRQKKGELENISVTAEDLEKSKNKIPTWGDIFLHADTATKRVLVNKLIKRIDITSEKIIIRFKINLEHFRS